MATTIKSSALDFNNIKNKLKIYLADQEEFSDYNFEASGLSNILDVLAYNTHINALTANFALNESYLNTAQLRSSVVSLAEGIGYIPDTDSSAQASVRISFVTNVSPRDSIIGLPAYTKFNTTIDDVTYTFQTIETYYATDNGSGFYQFVDAAGSDIITLYEGTQRTKTFLAGEYVDNPVYIIPDTTIDAKTVTVKVFETGTSSVSTTYQNVANITTVSAESAVYILKESPNGFFELSFGDGKTFGVAPKAGNRVEVSYLSTQGDNGNGATTFSAVSSLNQGGVIAPLNVQTVGGSKGGQAKESIESIKKNAPFQYATQNRMITPTDYKSLILRNYSSLVNDVMAWGGEDNLDPEFGSVYVAILFEDGVAAETQAATKRGIVDLAEQLGMSGFNVRFVDPVETFVEIDAFFQFNPKLTDQTINAVQTNTSALINNYFGADYGLFSKSFRRSNLLSVIDNSNSAILSSRMDVRMQQRFVPSAPNIIAVINNLTNSALSVGEIDYVVDLMVRRKYDAAAKYLVDNQYTSSNYTVTRTTLASTSVRSNQVLRFPVALATPDDEFYRISSTEFTLGGRSCVMRNKLGSTSIEVVSNSGDVVIDNVGNYAPGTGAVTINYFNPSNISGGANFIKLSGVPANPSSISPVRNNLLKYDQNRSSTVGVIVSATN